MTTPTPATPCYGPGMEAALTYAATAFRHTTRKGSRIPYLTHLLAVAALVGEHGGSEEQMIAALLHDVLEDIEGVTHEDLKTQFGVTVADTVEALSDTTTHPKPAWRERKTRYISRLAQESAFVKLVSAADKLHNLQSLLRDLNGHGDVIWSRFNAGREDQLWYYQAVLEALATGWESAILAELQVGVAELERRVRC